MLIKKCIIVYDVKKAIKLLKLGKADGDEGLYSDHVAHAPHIFFCIDLYVI